MAERYPVKGERDFEAALQAVLEAISYLDLDDAESQSGAEEATAFVGARIESFENSGLLTRDAGLVVRLPGGAEFQITIKQSDGFVYEDDDEDDDDAPYGRCSHCGAPLTQNGICTLENGVADSVEEEARHADRNH